MDPDSFPEALRTEASTRVRLLERLRTDPDLDCAFPSLSAGFAPGGGTGHFRLGGDQLRRDAQGKCHISMEDFAIARADDAEQHAPSCQHFAVGC